MWWVGKSMYHVKLNLTYTETLKSKAKREFCAVIGSQNLISLPKGKRLKRLFFSKFRNHWNFMGFLFWSWFKSLPDFYYSQKKKKYGFMLLVKKDQNSILNTLRRLLIHIQNIQSSYEIKQKQTDWFYLRLHQHLSIEMNKNEINQKNINSPKWKHLKNLHYDSDSLLPTIVKMLCANK